MLVTRRICGPAAVQGAGHAALAGLAAGAVGAGVGVAVCLAAHEPAVRHVVSLAGVLDLHAAYDQHLSNDAVVEFLGGTPKQVTDHYRDAEFANIALKSYVLDVGKSLDAQQFSCDILRRNAGYGGLG